MIEKNKILESWIMVEHLSEGDIGLNDKAILTLNDLQEQDFYSLFLHKIEKKKWNRRQKGGVVVYFDIFKFQEVVDILHAEYGLEATDEDIRFGDKFSFALYFDKNLNFLEDMTFFTESAYIRKFKKVPYEKEFREFEKDFKNQLAQDFDETAGDSAKFNAAMQKELLRHEVNIINCRMKILGNIETEATNLHSFFIDDLEKAKKIETVNLNAYLYGNKKERMNLDSKKDSVNFHPHLFEQILQPKNYPLGRFPSNTTYALSLMQQVAVNLSIGFDNNQMRSVNGPPGTGKTTTINAMIEYFHSENMEIMLAAPTGRAAKRMTEATGWEAQTIHRLLEVNGNPEVDENPNRNGFARNADNPLETDVIIIDEMSMVDLSLMNALLTAIVPGTRLILVGDCNQLPSVGPGSILKDLIASECFPVVMLTRIFRQAQESDIVVNAHKINRGEPVLLDNKSRDFFFLKRQDPNVIISVLLTLIQKKLPKYVNAKPYDIQVLTPMRKGLLGVERLNSILQQYLNPPEPGKAEKEYGDHKFRVGDKVMQIKNNYQLEWEITTKYGLTVDKGMGIFNGDMGIVTEINTYTETLEVEYDEKRKVKYPFELLEELELAYAITIHKSQGSEYPAVVIPLLSGPRQLFHRNLLYTAITRARKCVTIVGNDQTFQEMIRNTNEHNRNTSLAERIREFCG